MRPRAHVVVTAVYTQTKLTNHGNCRGPQPIRAAIMLNRPSCAIQFVRDDDRGEQQHHAECCGGLPNPR